MYGKHVPLFCLSYIVGLLIASGIEDYWLTILIFGVITGALFWKFHSNHQWSGLRSRSYITIILIILISFVSFYTRFPTPTINDVSKLIPPNANGTNVTIVGNVLNAPTLNRSGKLRFWLTTEAVKENTKKQAVSGKLYTTIPANLKTKVNPGSKIKITGYLYKPQTPKNPGQFDFGKYLRRNGAFAGISGRKLTVLEEESWGFWQLRDRAINVHQEALGSPNGELLSSMVLGRKAVNLPYEIQDQFLKAGLAHILAASGFHVSLLLGVVLGLTKPLQVSQRFAIGIGILVLYVGLTGLQPSILRASLMGVAGLLGLLTERKVNSTRSLLVIATILLLINPLWIIDLGFQFSFLATFGLIVTLPVLLTKLDFLPPTIASVIAVPIAVFPWIFPLQLFHFGTVATYSIFLNVLVTPLAIFLILGGMLSGFIGLLIPDLGSAIALLLFYPIQLLINLVSGLNQIPGSYLFFGKIVLWQLIGIYSLFLLIWQFPKGQKYWKQILIGAIVLLILPITYKQLTLRQVTVFATEQPAVILLQNRGKVTLINCGDQDTIRYTILPFLQQEGISKIDNAIALKSNNKWHHLNRKIPIQTLFYNPTLETKINSLPDLQSISKQPISNNITLIQNQGVTIKAVNPLFLKMNLGTSQWGILNYPTQMLPTLPSNLEKIDILLWSGKEISRSWLEQLKPESAIAVTNQISDDLEENINQTDINFYVTGKDGAIQWTSKNGLRSWLN